MHSAFDKLYESVKRYFLLTGGRGSLKSSNVHEFVAELCDKQSGHGVLFTRYTMQSAKVSIVPEFRAVCERLGYADKFTFNNNIVKHKETGSFVYFSGIKTSQGNQTGRLKGISGITTWVIEEGEDFNDEKAFDIIDDSIRTTTHQNRIIWIQNPTSKEHFIYKRWISETNQKVKYDGFDVTMSTHPQVEHIHTTYKIAEEKNFLDKDWLLKAQSFFDTTKAKVAKIKKSFKGSRAALRNEIYKAWHTSHYYYNYVGGWLERAEGVVFDNWIEGEFDESLPFVRGLDYGYSPDPLAMVKVAVDRKKKLVYVKEEIYETHLDDVVSAIGAVGVSKKELIVADTNEPRTTTRISKKFNIVKAIKEKIADDIREIKEYTLVVTPCSKNVKIELNNYVWNDKKASIPVDDFNHSLDALRYGFRRLMLGNKRGVRRRN